MDTPDIYQINSNPRRLVVALVDGTFVVCSDVYEFNGDTVAVYGEPISNAADGSEPADGTRIEDPDEALLARAVGAIGVYMKRGKRPAPGSKVGFCVLEKRIEPRLLRTNRHIVVVRFDNEFQEAMVVPQARYDAMSVGGAYQGNYGEFGTSLAA